MPGIVINRLKLVYWPIPKCACTTIKTRIAEYEQIPIPPGPGGIHTAPFRWTVKSIKGFLDVAVVRHPLERVVSLWREKVGPDHPPPLGLDPAVFGRFPLAFYDGMPLSLFIAAIGNIGLKSADPHWAPQHTQFPTGAKLFKLEDIGRFLGAKLNVTVAPRVETSLDLERSVQFYYGRDYVSLGYD